MSRQFVSPFTVGSFDADALGEIRPSALVRRLQEAADGHARQHQLAVDQLLATGRTWVLREFHLRILRTPRFLENCRITTWASSRSAGLRAWRDFVLESDAGESLAIATSLWLMLDTTRWKLIRLPPEVFTMVNPEPQPVLAPLDIADDFHTERPPVEVEVHWLDVDFNGHVNNVRYLDWMMGAIPDSHWREKRLVSLAADFQAEARPDDTLLVFGGVAEAEPLAFHSLVTHSNAKPLIRGTTTWEPRSA